MTGICFVQNYTDTNPPVAVPDSKVEADLTATLEPWQALECGFINDNTAFVKINKTTTNPADSDTLFTFNVTMSNGTEIHPELTIENNETFNMTGLIQVSSGTTTIGEILLPTGWKNNMTGICFVQNYTDTNPPVAWPATQE